MNEFLEILSREVDNSDRIYLYPEDGNWCAYEQSACRLKQLFPQCAIQQVTNHTYEVVLIRTLIHDNYPEGELEGVLSLVPEVLIHDGYLEILVRRQKQILFDTWKQTELANMVTAIEFERA